MSEPPKYKRLMRGPMLSLFGRSSLWLAEDHLLSVEQLGTNERYRRFSFEEIQALVICETERRFFIGLVLGTLVAIGLLITVASDSLWGRISGGSIMGFFGLLMVINIAKGPCCVCNLRTAVSVTRLGAVKRLKKIEGVLPDLTALIAERQGVKDPGEIIAGLESRERAIPEASSPRDGYARLLPARAGGASSYSGNLHLGLFSLLLVDGALALLTFIGSHPLIIALRMAVVLAALFCAIVALMRHKGRRSLKPLLPSTITSVVYLSAGAIGIYVIFVTMHVRYPETVHNTMDLIRHMATAGPYDGVGWLLFFVVNAGISGLLGAIGLLHTFGYRAKKDKVVAPPIPSET